MVDIYSMSTHTNDGRLAKIQNGKYFIVQSSKFGVWGRSRNLLNCCGVKYQSCSPQRKEDAEGFRREKGFTQRRKGKKTQTIFLISC